MYNVHVCQLALMFWKCPRNRPNLPVSDFSHQSSGYRKKTMCSCKFSHFVLADFWHFQEKILKKLYLTGAQEGKLGDLLHFFFGLASLQIAAGLFRIKLVTCTNVC